MKKNIVLFSAVLLVIFTGACKNAPEITNGSIPRSVPEAEGVSSEAIITFLDSAMASEHEFHSIMILRHGKVIAEGWWDPYAPELKHTLYSTSKSFTSTAVGFAVTEKLLTVNDKVVSFFTDELPDTVSPYLSDLTIKDLLTMSVGMDPDPTFLRFSDTNWVQSFLSVPILNKPGTKFLYNSLATYMLSAIVQKVTGQKIVDYLTPRLFEPLGIQGIDWEVDPNGINTGGWGLRVKTEDMAKFGLLYLQKGQWNGKQIIPAEWVEEATTAQIQQDPKAPRSRKDSSDWLQGYGYQFWRCRNNAFRADGAFGQFIIMMPEQDAVIAITAESPDMQSEINLVWKYLLPAMKDEKLPENNAMAENLKQRLESLRLQVTDEKTISPAASAITSKNFSLDTNILNWESLSFNFSDNSCIVKVVAENKEYSFSFGEGKWIGGETDKPGPSLTGNLGGIDKYRIAGSYVWTDENTLHLILRYIESPHHEKITCRFDGAKLLMQVAPSIASLKPVTEITGKLVPVSE